MFSVSFECPLRARLVQPPRRPAHRIVAARRAVDRAAWAIGLSAVVQALAGRFTTAAEMSIISGPVITIHPGKANTCPDVDKFALPIDVHGWCVTQ